MALAAPTFRWTLGDRLRKARKAAGLEQADMARLIGTSRPNVSKWERNLVEPRVSQLIKWAEVTKTTTADLLGESTSARVSHSHLTGLPTQTDRRYRSPIRNPLLTIVDPM